MNSPLITIFVQAYNTERFVGDCLRSVFALTGNFPLEVIVIDDASRDATPDVVRSFNDGRLRFVRHQSNCGAIATANEGYSLARGKYVARIDSDDRYCPAFLERTVPILEAEPRIGLVYGDMAMIDAQGRMTASGQMVRREGRAARGDEFFPLLLDNFIPSPTTLMRHKALEPLLPISNDLKFLDWYLTTGIAETWDLCYVDEVLADYRIHTHNMHRTMIQDKTGEQTIFRVLDRYFGSSVRAEEKRIQRERVYGRNYLVCAEKYFGHVMNADARRCYIRAFLHEPSLLLRAGVTRRFLASFLPRSLYDGAKRQLKPILTRSLR